MNLPKTKNEIAHDLGISLRTLQRWLKKAGLKIPRGLVCPKKQEEILKTLGYQVDEEDTTE